MSREEISEEVWSAATYDVASDMCLDCERYEECHLMRQKFEIDTGKECPEYVNAVYDLICEIIYGDGEVIHRLFGHPTSGF